MPLDLSDAVLARRQYNPATNAHLRAYTILRDLPPYVPTDRLAVDVGGATGHITHFLADHAAHVMAFEAVEPVFRQLQKWETLKVNVSTYHLAVSNFDGEAEFFVDDKRLSNSGFQNLVDGQMTKVRAVSLDSFLKRRQIPVGFIKIDVEGTELDVLKGAEQVIDSDRPNFMVEIYEPFTQPPLSAIFDFMFSRNYECHYFDPRSGLVHVPDTVAGVDAVVNHHKRHDGDFLFVGA
jgi:FkbM family methyltransferase